MKAIRKIFSLLLAGFFVLFGSSVFMQSGGASALGPAVSSRVEPGEIAVGTTEEITAIEADPTDAVSTEPPEPTPTPVVMVNVLGTEYPSDTTTALDLSGRGRDAILSAVLKPIPASSQSW